jgi:hypothetical protein
MSPRTTKRILNDIDGHKFFITFLYRWDMHDPYGCGKKKTLFSKNTGSSTTRALNHKIGRAHV